MPKYRRRLGGRGATPVVPVLLRESAATLAPPARMSLREAATFGEAAPGVNGSVIDVQIIRAGWGSSGYYPAPVVARDGPKAFRAGTHLYVDHPTQGERHERPERSLRDLAAVLVENAYTTDNGQTLRAKARVFGPFQALIREAWRDIGVSIRAYGTAQPGEAEGRTGLVVQTINEAESVDFVTRAAAGGQIVALLESARGVDLVESGSIGAWVESRLHLSLTATADDMYGYGQLTREERIAISRAVGASLDAFVASLQAGAPQLYERDRWGDQATLPPQPLAVAESAATVGGDGATIPAVTTTVVPLTESSPAATTAPPAASPTDVPDGAPPAAPNPPNPGEEAPMSGSNPTGPAPGGEAGTATASTSTVDVAAFEARLAAAEQSAAEAQRAATAADARAEQAEAANRQLRAGDTARATVRRLLNESSVDNRVRPMLVAPVEQSVLGRVPLTESGEVDQAALDTAVTAAITAQSAYAAELVEALVPGYGTPRGLGGASAPNPVDAATTETDADEYEKDITAAFERMGMPSKRAAIAGKGRS